MAVADPGLLRILTETAADLARMPLPGGWNWEELWVSELEAVRPEQDELLSRLAGVDLHA